MQNRHAKCVPMLAFTSIAKNPLKLVHPIGITIELAHPIMYSCIIMNDYMNSKMKNVLLINDQLFY